MQARGVRLRGRWGVMVFNFQTWQRLLQLAQSYGWQPNDQSLNYYLRAGQIVHEGEALAIASALERSLPDIPDHQAVATASENQPAIPELRRIKAGIGLVEWFSGNTKQNVINFIQFCRVGGDFQID